MLSFSIIVPIYNAQKTLERCLRSLQTQSVPNFEVILVENGSSDSSGDICKAFSDTDARFHLLTQLSNLGPSGARNIGLDHATGKWIAFVDSDDFVEPDYLEQLQQAFEKNDAEAVFFGYRQISIEGKFLGQHVPKIPESMDYHKTLILLSQQDMFGYAWIKAFRRDTIGNNRFSQQLNLLEDEVFTCEILTKQKQIAILSEPIYNYVTGNAGSLMGRTHQDYCSKLDMAYCAWKNLLKKSPCYSEALTARANADVTRCMYYGFERDVKLKDFFTALSQCAFFGDASTKNRFVKYVRDGRIGSLRRMRTAYRMKIKAAKLLKK